MNVLNFVRRCKNKTGTERHETIHAADNSMTFCGKELNEMWFIESSAGLDKADVSCRKCRKAMHANADLI